MVETGFASKGARNRVFFLRVCVFERRLGVSPPAFRRSRPPFSGPEAPSCFHHANGENRPLSHRAAIRERDSSLFLPSPFFFLFFLFRLAIAFLNLGHHLEQIAMVSSRRRESSPFFSFFFPAAKIATERRGFLPPFSFLFSPDSRGLAQGPNEGSRSFAHSREYDAFPPPRPGSRWRTSDLFLFPFFSPFFPRTACPPFRERSDGPSSERLDGVGELIFPEPGRRRTMRVISPLLFWP